MLPLWMHAIALAPTCFCFDHPTAREAWQQAEVVMTATVVKIDEAPTNAWDPYTVTVRADEVFKGSKAQGPHSFLGGRDHCLKRYKVGEQWLLYLGRRDERGQWSVHQCNRSRERSEAGDGFDVQPWLPGKISEDGHAEIELAEGAHADVDFGLRHATVYLKRVADGRVRFSELIEGQYRLEANPGGSITTKDPFPKTTFPDGKESIRLGKGERMENIVMQAGPLSPRVRIDGRLEFASGEPVKHGEVLFVRDEELVSSSDSAADGSFELLTLKGQEEGWLNRSSGNCRETPGRGCPTMDAGCVRFSTWTWTRSSCRCNGCSIRP